MPSLRVEREGSDRSKVIKPINGINGLQVGDLPSPEQGFGSISDGAAPYGAKQKLNMVEKGN